MNTLTSGALRVEYRLPSAMKMEIVDHVTVDLTGTLQSIREKVYTNELKSWEFGKKAP